MEFVQGIKTILYGISDSEAVMKVVGKSGQNVATLLIRCAGEWGVHFYEITAWEREAVLLRDAVDDASIRVIVLSDSQPVPDPFWIGKDRKQFKIKVDDLWVESIIHGRFEEIIRKVSGEAKPARVLEPLEVPGEVMGFSQDGEPTSEEKVKAVTSPGGKKMGSEDVPS